jgi:hypothetical protein
MFDKIMIRRLLPPAYRQPKMIAYLKAMVGIPYQYYKDFKKWRLQQLRCLRYSSQTLSLQEFLRIQFSNIEIEIITQRMMDMYIFWKNENRLPNYIYWGDENKAPKYIYWHDELDTNQSYDFIVRVPQILASFEAEIRFYVDKLKLASKQYKIIYF